MQLTKINIQKNLKLSKSVFEENIFLIKKDFRKTPQLTTKNSLSQRKDIPNDPESQLIKRTVQNDTFLKNLISLAEKKEKDIPVIPQSQLIERGISGNLLLGPYSPDRKVIFLAKQDVSFSKEGQDISEKNVLSQLTKNIVQNNFSWSEKLFFRNERYIYSIKEKEKLLQLTRRRTIQNNFLLKRKLLIITDDQAASIPSLRLEQIRSDSIRLPYQSVVYRRYPPKDIQQTFQGFGKKARKGNNSVYKVKLSPPLEENWQGQESTGFDNSGSADKCDSIVKYKFMVPNHYAKHQSIAKTPEEHIKIFKIFSCFKQLIDISEKVLLVNSIVESIESVVECSNFEKYSKRNPKNSLTIYIYKEKDFGENLKCQIIKVQEFEKTLEESIIKIKDSEEILTNQVTKKDINNSP
ncbi:hypothetical protein ALC60_07273 [Trachymyrmex zeteki]|uniref:Uncharacterized protein n=1 Tax=Mycetomoellerius zeteki TaxID=64791 RepID=A0A151X0N9_9HYME|nr:hypothetical protein ALC60_07273 [Trachymyrmex zeteki]